jgi:mRNA interferase YafQ
MPTIKYTSRFKRDYNREKSGILGKRLNKLLMAAGNMLAADQPLPERRRDHQLAGEWKDHRDCHIRPDLVLICRKPDDDNLELVRLGSHRELNRRSRAGGGDGGGRRGRCIRHLRPRGGPESASTLYLSHSSCGGDRAGPSDVQYEIGTSSAHTEVNG